MALHTMMIITIYSISEYYSLGWKDFFRIIDVNQEKKLFFFFAPENNPNSKVELLKFLRSN